VCSFPLFPLAHLLLTLLQPFREQVACSPNPPTSVSRPSTTLMGSALLTPCGLFFLFVFSALCDPIEPLPGATPATTTSTNATASTTTSPNCHHPTRLPPPLRWTSINADHFSSSTTNAATSVTTSITTSKCFHYQCQLSQADDAPPLPPPPQRYSIPRPRPVFNTDIPPPPYIEQHDDTTMTIASITNA